MRFRRLQIRLQTTDGPYGVALDFPDGLVVFWADNSTGKSTCVKSILVALGMEAMLTVSRSDLPLPPAVKSRLAANGEEVDVLESEVFLEIENDRGQRIVTQRTIKGERDKNLITVHGGPVLTAPGTSAPTRDFFVNQAGAATREHGFHHFLAGFLGWKLPTVQNFDGDEYPLYLQCVFPYFVVEQTRGWSTIQPPLPNHFRIRDAHKRAVEFLLDLDAHQVALRRQEILFEKSRVESDWAAKVTQANDVAEAIAGTIQALPRHPVLTWPPQIPPSLVIPSGSNWITLDQRMAARASELEKLVQQEIPRVQEIVSSAESDLVRAEQQTRDQQALLSRLLDKLEMEQQEVARVEERLTLIDDDIQRNKDVRTLKKLGSRQGAAIDGGTCPICHQSIQDSLLPLAADQAVMTLDENIDFLTEQRRTFEVVLSNAKRVADARASQVRTVHDEVNSLRESVRALRQTLLSDGRVPSIAAIRSRIELETAIRRDEQYAEQFKKSVGRFTELVERWRAIQDELQKLPKSDVTDRDKAKITKWTESVRNQLTQYGFGSFQVDQVVVSPDSYRPEHEGFDLESSFALQTSISASDLIRTIWSYLTGLLELSRTVKTNHPGCIIFDEPRQQSARDVSFAELLRRASSASDSNQQVIFFTSENIERLRMHLSGLRHTLFPINGRVLKKLSPDQGPATNSQ